MSDGQWISLSRWRLLGGLVLGHLAAAFSFAASMLLFVALTDSSSSLPRTLDWWASVARGVAISPLVVAGISFWTFALMLPASVLTSPLTYFAARELRTGLGATVVIGGAIGMVDVCLMLAWFGDFGASTSPGHPGAPPVASMFVVCGAVAGMAYSAVVWRLCIRPRLYRYGGAHWREV